MVGHYLFGIFHGFHQQHPPFGKLPHRAFHFHMAFVAYHDDLVALRIKPRHFFVHFGYQRAGGVEYAETARGSLFLHSLRYAVGGINQRRAGRHVGQILDKNRAFFAQVVHHEFVVHHLVPHINRCAEFLQCALDDADGAVHARTEAARIGQHDGFAAHCSRPSAVSFSDGLLLMNPSITSNTAPTQIKLSATLKAGYAQPSP